METTLKPDRLAGRFRGRSRSRFLITDREMIPADGQTLVMVPADGKTLVLHSSGDRGRYIRVVAKAYLMLIIQFYRNKNVPTTRSVTA